MQDWSFVSSGSDGVQASHQAASDGVVCGICLGRDDEVQPVKLTCGHDFCKSCLHRHVFAELCKGLEAWCPTCRQEMRDNELALYCPQAVTEAQNHLAHVGAAVTAPPQGTWWQRKILEPHRFRKAARRANLKFCPNCRSPIEKNGGCNQMACRQCRHRFDWQSAEPVAPCRHCHTARRGVPIWGSTCPGCSLFAKAQLAVLRTTVVIGAVPVGAAAAVIALPVLPFVGACKAVKHFRRLRRERLVDYDVIDTNNYDASSSYAPTLSGSLTPPASIISRARTTSTPLI